jgi:hypothetical protein
MRRFLMKDWRKARPSPAMVVALIALFVAMGGSAAALSGSNTVQSDDLGPGAQVKAPDVATNAVNSADVAPNSLTGADVQNLTGGDVTNDSLTGLDVNESTLQGIDAASVDGANVCDGVVELSTSSGDPTVEQEVCAQGPLSITATCDTNTPGSTTAALTLDTSADDSFLDMSDPAQEDPDWDATDLGGFVFATSTDAVGALDLESFATGAPDGSQLVGDAAVRARNLGGSDGNCHFALGAIG